MLLCPQRSGSTALTTLLNQYEGVKAYDQLFKNGFEHRYYLKRDFGMPLFRACPDTMLHFGPTPPLRLRAERQALRLVAREHDLDRHVETFWERYGTEPDLRAVGFKLHDYQLTEDDMLAVMRRHLDGVVVLHRENLLKAAVSWAYAVHTGVWMRKEKPKKALAPIRLDLDELRWFMEKTPASIAQWRRLTEAAGVPTIWLTYEEHVQPKNLNGLKRFLGVPEGAEAEFTIRKLSTAKYEHIANAEEINQRLGSSETGYLFEPAAHV